MCTSPRPHRRMPVWAPRPRRACNGIPVHPTLVWPRFACMLARHQARSTAPPPPSALELTPDRTGPETDHTLPELPRVPARPSRHRHPRMLPCTQCTVPPRTATHGAQWSPTQACPRPSLHRQIKGEASSRSHPSPSFAPPLSPLICRTSPAPGREGNATGEREQRRGRSSPTRVKVEVNLSVLLLSLSSSPAC
jgi:hypothetical protein